MTASAHYTFGDNDLAFERLRLLAAVFSRSSAPFIKHAQTSRPLHVIDLGAGPGFSTMMLDAVLAPDAITGLEASARYVELARKLAHPKLVFVEQDVTAAPFACAPGNLLYSRFLLTHLPGPTSALSTWYEAAAPGALLLLEETAYMRASHPALNRYYEIVEALQRHHGQAMYIGRDLAELAARSPWRVRHAALPELVLPLHEMAALHALNIRTWRTDAFVRERYESSELDRLEHELRELAAGGASGEVRCGMGQVVLERAR